MKKTAKKPNPKKPGRSGRPSDEALQSAYMSGEFPLEPLGDRVILRRLGQTTMHRGLHLPTQFLDREKPTMCEVKAVGPGKYVEETGLRTPMVIKVGQHVLIGKFAGTVILSKDKDENEHEFLVVRQDEVMCGVNTRRITAHTAPNY